MTNLKKLPVLFVFFLSSFMAVAESNCAGQLVEVPDAAWGSSFLNSYEAFDFSKSPISFALQVQALHGSSFSRGQVAETIKRTIESRYPSTTAKVEGPPHQKSIQYTRKGRKYTYRLVGNPDIQKVHGYSHIQINSPVLKEEDDVELFHEIMNSLSLHNKLIPEPDSAAVRVRVGLPGGRAHEMAMLEKLYSSMELELKEVFSADKSLHEGESPRTSRFVNQLAGPGTEKISFKSIDSLLEGEHTFGLGTDELERFGAVEFRLFNSAVSEEELKMMMDFSEKIVKAVRSKDPDLMKVLAKYEGQRPPFEELVEAIGFDIQSKQSKKVLRKMYIESFKASIGRRLAEHPYTGKVVLGAAGLIGILSYFSF